jgi:hypothetical protein
MRKVSVRFIVAACSFDLPLFLALPRTSEKYCDSKPNSGFSEGRFSRKRTMEVTSCSGMWQFT